VWLALFSLIFFALDQAEQALLTELGGAVGLACVWTCGDYARNAALSSARGDGSPYREGAHVKSLFAAYWSTRLVMWIGFLGTACFVGRLFANWF
jgi:hypothetical protein